MQIGIDGNEANVPQKVGSNVYAFQVLNNLAKLNSPHNYKIYLRSNPLSFLPLENKNWHYEVFGPRKFWTQIALPLKLFLEKEKPSVFYSPGHYAPRFSSSPSVVTILDTSYLFYPQYFNKKDLLQLKSWSAYSIKNANKIITISNSSKNDLLKYYGLNEKKVKVIYPGYDKERFKLSLSAIKSQEIAIKYKLPQSYVLFVGTLQPRKNLITLIKALEKLKSTKDKYSNLELVIIGKKGWIYDKILKEIDNAKIKNQIKMIGFVADQDLPYLYQKASCFILPSLYEGFGLPVLEAMSVGVPVVVSNSSSLPEVAGKAGIYIFPQELESLIKGIDKALSLNPQEKEAIIRSGLEQAKKFSWDKCAKEILSVLLSV